MSHSWTVTLFCPLLGLIISNAKGLAPIKVLLRARENKSLAMKGDYWLFLSNCFSMILGVWLCLTAIHILEQTVEDDEVDEILRLRVEGILMFTFSFWLMMSFLVALPLRGDEYYEFNFLFVGSFAVVSSLVFYASPLMHIAEVIKTNDSSSLYWPAILVNMLSCMLWFFYGLEGVKAPVVWIPNGLGALLCVVELVTCWYFPQLERNAFDADGPKIAEPTPRRNQFAAFESSRGMSIEDLLARPPLVRSDSHRFKRNLGKEASSASLPCIHEDVIPLPQAPPLRKSASTAVSLGDDKIKFPSPFLKKFRPPEELFQV